MIGLKSGTVELHEYNNNWPYIFNNEKIILNNLLKNYYLDIEHIGSTSIIGCIAKPIIDIMISVNNFDNSNEIINILTKEGYEYKGDAGIP